MTKEEICECECEHDKNCHDERYGDCRVVGCECKKFKPKNHSHQGSDLEDKEPEDAFHDSLSSAYVNSGSDDDSSLSSKIDEWFTSECKNECDPKGHIKVVGSDELKELKKHVKEFVKKLKEALYHEVGLFWDLRHYNIAKREIDKLAGKELI